MKAKNKAKELVDRFMEITPTKDFINLTPEEASGELLRDLKLCKQCALICVEEIIKQSMDDRFTEKYWRTVKQEIEKL